MVRYGRHASCSMRTEHRTAAYTISSRFKGARMPRVASWRSRTLPRRWLTTTSFSAYRRPHTAAEWWRAFRTPISKVLSRLRRNRTHRWASRGNSISVVILGISRASGGRRRMPPWRYSPARPTTWKRASPTMCFPTSGIQALPRNAHPIHSRRTRSIPWTPLIARARYRTTTRTPSTLRCSCVC